MAVGTGYGKVATSGLIFAYDTSDTINSYKGEPTTNYVTNASTFNGGWGSYVYGNDGMFITEFGTTGYKIINRGSWNGLVSSFSIPSPGTVSFSAWFRYWGGSSNNNGGTVYTSGWGIGSDTAVGVDKSKVGVWQRVVNTQYCPGTSGYFYIISYGGTYGADNSTWDVTMPQIEIKSHVTPFVNGTRSNTQGLIDISGKGNSLDLANTAFDSSAQIYYDGASYVGGTNLGLINDFTVELWFKSDSVANYRNPIDCNWLVYPGSYSNVGPRLEQTSGGALGWCVGDSGGGYSGFNIVNSGLDGNKYHHAVITRSGSSFLGYYNGVNTGSLTFNNWYSAISNINIGRGFSTSSERWFVGKVPIVRVYNRVLSATEIKQNFDHSKAMFGLS